MKINDKVICTKELTCVDYYTPKGLPKVGQVCCVEDVQIKSSKTTFIKLTGFPLVNKENGKYGLINASNFKKVGRVLV